MESEDKRDYPFFGEDQDEVKTRVTLGPTHSTKISENFGQNSMDRFGPTGKVSKKLVFFSQSERSEFWLNGSRPQTESFLFLIKIHFKLR